MHFVLWLDQCKEKKKKGGGVIATHAVSPTSNVFFFNSNSDDLSYQRIRMVENKINAHTQA